MTRLTYQKKEETHPTFFRSHEATGNENGQVLHLKRLLVTVKQHYEKSLQELQIQFQAEQSQHLAAKKKIERFEAKLAESGQQHEEELQALRKQQEVLKEMLKKSKEEVAQLREDLSINGYIESDEGKESAFSSLYQEIARLKKLNQELLEKLSLGEQESQREIEQLRQLLEDRELDDAEVDTVVSTTSSHHLRRELEMIKSMLVDGAKESKVLEARFVEVLNEKIEIGQQCSRLEGQLESQSTKLTALQDKISNLEEQKRSLEHSLQSKDSEWVESCQQRQELQIRIESLNAIAKEKEFIQDKYEQLKEEWMQANERLDEANEARQLLDTYLSDLAATSSQQEGRLEQLAEEMQSLHEEKNELEGECDHLRVLLEESEGRLKVAQQHLAKKVKEAAILSEKLEEHVNELEEFNQTMEEQKGQIAQLQASVELYQRQEAKLQGQLHEALKGTESQIVKWEEKYFRMYDKWQESENRLRDLRKIEEKHLQMQNLLANLGNFMGGGASIPLASLLPGEDVKGEEPRPFAFQQDVADEVFSEEEERECVEETYNLFGMRQLPPHD